MVGQLSVRGRRKKDGRGMMSFHFKIRSCSSRVDVQHSFRKLLDFSGKSCVTAVIFF